MFNPVSLLSRVLSPLLLFASPSEVQDTRWFGPPYSPATLARITRDKYLAQFGGQQSIGFEANYAYHAVNSEGHVLFSEESSLGNGLITVTQHGPWRVMLFDDIEQGIAYFNEDDGLPRADVIGFEYLRVMAAAAMAARHIAPSMKSDNAALCVGLGTGALPGFIAHHFGDDLRVEVVELDPIVVRAADDALQCRFSLARGKNAVQTKRTFGVTLDDAATYLRRLLTQGSGPSSLSTIFLDAYDCEGRTPKHLMEPAFLSECKEALAPGGVLVCNLFNGATGSRSRSSAEAFAAVLEESVGAVMSLEVPTQEESMILMARPGPAHERPGADDLRSAAREAYAAVGLSPRVGEGLVRKMRWVETGGGFVEFEPPPSTANGAGAAFAGCDLAKVLRRGNSAVEWAAGAGPPAGLD